MTASPFIQGSSTTSIVLTLPVWPGRRWRTCKGTDHRRDLALASPLLKTGFFCLGDLSYSPVTYRSIVIFLVRDSKIGIKRARLIAAILKRAPLIAGYHNDFFMLDSNTTKWAKLSGALVGAPPTGRWNVGSTSAHGKFFVFGGQDSSGTWYLRHICIPKR